MATKTKIAMIDPEDPEFKKEHSAVSVDMDVQEFEEDYSGLEVPEEITQKNIQYLEKLIRKSYEYKQYIYYLKTELDITKCALIPTLDINQLDISLEFHHYPITLYDIVETILKEKMYTKKEDEKIILFDVMEEVMKEHYVGIIGLVPLSTTMHEMAHSGSIEIPYDSIYGNYDKFIEKHHKYMTPELVAKIESCKLVDRETAEEFNKKLEKNVLQYNIKYNQSKENEDNK